MSVIYLLISISIIVAAVFLYAFLRAVKTGQYDDDYTPSVRMLFDDELIKEIPNSKIPVLSNSKISGEEPKPITKEVEPKPI
jgi:cbb3-type cytochrome oxidase maturation protein